MILLICDAGHKLSTPGKQTPPFKDGSVVKEYVFNRGCVDKIIQIAKSKGWHTYDTSPDSEKLDITVMDRIKRANTEIASFKRANPNGIVIFVSIHFNAHKSDWESSKANGIEVIYYDGNEEDKRLAQCVYNEIIKGTKQTGRGLKPSKAIYVTANAKCPAILCEFGFMDDPEEAKLMTNEAYQMESAKEVIQGVSNFIGIQMPKHEEILRRDTNNPELWLKFIEEMKDHPTGKWLPNLIIALGGK